MAYDRFLVAPINTGLEKDLKPFLIPDDAFERLNNAYVFRGRVRKRFGSFSSGGGVGNMIPYHSRVRIPLSGGAAVGIANGAGNATGTVPGAIFKIGQAFTIGTERFTVFQNGAMNKTGATAVATYNTATGAYNFAGATPNTQVYFYAAEPIMGITYFDTDVSPDKPTVAFDTQFAYILNGGSWERSGTTVWRDPLNTFANFFESSNWVSTTNQRILFVSNSQVTNLNGAVVATDDPMYSFDGSTWTAFSPKFLVAGAGNLVKTAQLVLPFKNRLVLLSTIETNAANNTNTFFPQRCRFSHFGSPLSATAYLERNEVGYSGGGFIDAATSELIVGAEYIKDRLIVFFERSTWELAYTGNQLEPFTWQKINTELGAKCSTSTVPFDKVILAVGETGVHACNGANVERIDTKIPNEVFTTRQSNSGAQRIAGIRDYYTEMVYWTWPTTDVNANSDIFPNKVLVYNYRNQSWALNDDCFTAFGYFNQPTEVPSLETTAAEFREIFAGNQQGYILIIKPDFAQNGWAMQLTNAVQVGLGVNLTIIDHTLQPGDCIQITWSAGSTTLDGNYVVATVIDANTVSITPAALGGAYLGGGVVSRISKIDILTKQINPYTSNGRDVYLAKTDFLVGRTGSGAVTVDYFPSSSTVSLIIPGIALGDNVLSTAPYITVPLEAFQERIWHTVFFQGEGDCIQLRLYMTDAQAIQQANPIWSQDFELNAMIFYTMPTANNLG